MISTSSQSTGPVILVDANNLFIRNYSAIPSLDIHGNPNGGIIGTLLTIRKFLSLAKPNKLILAWDGPGGSKRRRSVNPEYKKGRKPAKLNRNYDFESHSPEKNRIEQRIKLGEYLDYLPVSQIILPDIEADDVIAYCCKLFLNDRKIICSNDKDFIQLLGANTIIYNLKKQIFITAKDAHEEYFIHPSNFAIARALVGDKSDNISGVGGIGFTTLLKLFPFFKEKEKIELNYILEYCKQKNDGKYLKILQNEQKVIDNYKIMRLDTSLISFGSVNKINEVLNQKMYLNSTSFRAKLLSDGINNINESFFHAFRVLEHNQ